MAATGMLRKVHRGSSSTPLADLGFQPPPVLTLIWMQFDKCLSPLSASMSSLP